MGEKGGSKRFRRTKLAGEGPGLPESVRVHLLISGYVQGVFFRASTQEMAAELGLAGWVRNLPDGEVEAVFEGEKKAVELAVSWSNEGPEKAVVESVDVRWEKPIGERGFRVRYA